MRLKKTTSMHLKLCCQHLFSEYKCIKNCEMWIL